MALSTQGMGTTEFRNLPLINRKGGLNGTILSEVVKYRPNAARSVLHDRDQDSSYTDRLSSVNKIFIIWPNEKPSTHLIINGLYWLTFCLRRAMS